MIISEKFLFKSKKSEALPMNIGVDFYLISSSKYLICPV